MTELVFRQANGEIACLIQVGTDRKLQCVESTIQEYGQLMVELREYCSNCKQPIPACDCPNKSLDEA